MDGLRKPAVANGLGPTAEQIDVARAVHRVDEMGPGWARSDLAKDDLAV